MPDRLAGERRSAAARQDRHAELIGNFNRGLNVGLMAGNHDAYRLDLVDRRIGRIEQPRVAIEANLPFNSLLELSFDLEGDRLWLRSTR